MIHLFLSFRHISNAWLCTFITVTIHGSSEHSNPLHPVRLRAILRPFSDNFQNKQNATDFDEICCGCYFYCQLNRYIFFRHLTLNPLTAKLFNLNFHPLEVVDRVSETQLQVSENYLYLTKWRSTVFKYC